MQLNNDSTPHFLCQLSEGTVSTLSLGPCWQGKCAKLLLLHAICGCSESACQCSTTRRQHEIHLGANWNSRIPSSQHVLSQLPVGNQLFITSAATRGILTWNSPPLSIQLMKRQLFCCSSKASLGQKAQRILNYPLNQHFSASSDLLP